MDKLTIELGSATGAVLPLRLRVHDRALLGHAAELVVVYAARVKDSRPVHAERELFRHRFTLDAVEQEVTLPRAALAGCYSHSGRQLELRLLTRLRIDDGLLIDSEFDAEHRLPLGDRPRRASGDPKQIAPADAYNLLANLSAIPAHNRALALALLLVGGLLVLLNLAIGAHDQLVPDAQAWLYDHYGDDGAESPFFKALAGSGVLGAMVWAALLGQLRRYMRLVLKPHPPLRRGLQLRLGELVEGESRVPLKGIRVRVVAANRERGQYRRKQGKKQRTVSFATPVDAVVLGEQSLNHVPAGVPISPYLTAEVDFTPMFADLLPPVSVGDKHGIDVVWEVQLLHPEYVDHELPGSSETLRYEDFLDP